MQPVVMQVTNTHSIKFEGRGGQGDLQNKRHYKIEEEREGLGSQQAARETVGSGRKLRPQVHVCVCGRPGDALSWKGPWPSEMEVRANPFCSIPHLMLSLRGEGRERRAH